MRKIIVLMFILSLMGLNMNGAKATNSELHDIVQAAENINLTNLSWTVTMKEKMTQTEIENNFKKIPEEFIITEQIDDQITTYTIREKNTNQSVSISYMVNVPENSNENGEWTAIISGENWDQHIRSQYQQIETSARSKYFSQAVHKFTCIEGHNRAILSFGHLLDEINMKLNITYHSLQDDMINNELNMQEAYGYIPNWNQDITIMDQPTNVHIAFIPKENGKDKVIIGTPILINEY